MAGTQIKIKQSAVLGKIPTAASLTQGELALNTVDQKLYSKDGSNTVFEIGGASAGANEILTTEYTATGGQVTFNAAYVLPNDHVNVYYNGMKLVAGDYTATSGSNVVLTDGALVDDLVVIEVIKALPLLNGSEIIEHEFTATATQTIFTITGGYHKLNDTIEVFINGIKLLASVDFARTDGTNVVLTTGADLDDEVTIMQIKMIALANVINSSGASAIIPAGTTAERDASPLAGYTRWNTTSSALESYNGVAWQSIDSDTTYSIQDGELSEINFTSADNTKLDGIDTGANNYTHPGTHTIADTSGLQSALDGKIDDGQVLTNVPVNAVFTDTNTVYDDTTIQAAVTLNTAKVGITSVQASAIAANTLKVTNVDHPLVETAVPVGAVFTDTETTTSIAIAANVLTYTDEAGINTDIDLSLYLDDTNLARLTSGTLNATTGLATFSRDDSSTFTIDFSSLLDDTTVTVNNTLTSTSTTEALSAAQGKELKTQLDIIAASAVAMAIALG